MQYQWIFRITASLMALLLCTGCGVDAHTSSQAPRHSDTPKATETEAAVTTTVTTAAATTAATTTTTAATTTVTTTTVVTTEATTVVTTTAPPVSAFETDGSATGEMQDDGTFLLSFYDGACQLPVPGDWKDKIFVQDGSVYHRAMCNAGEGGILFTVYVDSDLEAHAGKMETLIGSTSSACVYYSIPIYCMPDSTDMAMLNEFSEMITSCESLFDSANCPTNCEHVNLYDFATVAKAKKGGCSGTWDFENDDMELAQNSPYLIFSGTSGTMAYAYGYEIYEGTYIVNDRYTEIAGANGDINPDNEASVVCFFNNRVHVARKWSTAPTCLEVSNMTGMSIELSYDTWAGYYWCDIDTWGSPEDDMDW